MYKHVSEMMKISGIFYGTFYFCRYNVKSQGDVKKFTIHLRFRLVGIYKIQDRTES